ncbi:MAG: hypothetical protein M1816_007118 [Peltula sp. TS41687]|nr:MAG: hypothetical protein M1816_007118 [Peltula sp. TS41687]
MATTTPTSRASVFLPSIGTEPIFSNLQTEEEQHERGAASLNASVLSTDSRRSHLGRHGRILGVGRRTLGIALLLLTVTAWTASNFVTSYIFADNTYSKPYFVIYMNTVFFTIGLIPTILAKIYRDGYHEFVAEISDLWKRRRGRYSGRRSIKGDVSPSNIDDEEMVRSTSHLLSVHAGDGDDELQHGPAGARSNLDQEPLSLQETIKLSLAICMPWFLASYSMAACLQYTTVASSTVLGSTSSIWTLLVGTWVGVEVFSVRKLVGVIASLVGVIMISRVDISGTTDENRGSFPHKTGGQLALGDAEALFSAVVYGIYTVLLKKRIGNEGRVNMVLFFGLVGLFNVVLLWPGFIILHLIGEETFQLPPTGRIWAVVILNSTISVLSDYCWAYAMLLTSPLVVTVGLGLSIPMSLIGQMLFSSQHSSAAYWIGALIVLASFIFINSEESKSSDAAAADLAASVHSAGRNAGRPASLFFQDEDRVDGHNRAAGIE